MSNIQQNIPHIIQQNMPRIITSPRRIHIRQNTISRWLPILERRTRLITRIQNGNTNQNKSKKNNRKIEIHSIDIFYRENTQLTENGLLGKIKRIRFGDRESKLITNIITNSVAKMNNDIANLITEFSHPKPKSGLFYKKSHIMRAAKWDQGEQEKRSYSITKSRVAKHGIKAFIHFLEPGYFESIHENHTNYSRFLDEIGSFGPIVEIKINLLSIQPSSKKKKYLYKIINQKFKRYYSTSNDSLIVNKTSSVNITAWKPIFNENLEYFFKYN